MTHPHACPARARGLLPRIAALAAFALAPALYAADDEPQVIVLQPSRGVYSLSVIPFRDNTGAPNAADTVQSVIEQRLAASGRFLVFRPRVVETTTQTFDCVGYEVQNAFPSPAGRYLNAGVDVPLVPTTTTERRLVRLPLVDFEASGDVNAAGGAFVVNATLKHLPTGSLAASVTGQGKGAEGLLEAARSAADALIQAATRATAASDADAILVEHRSGVRTFANAEAALLRLALSQPKALDPQAALLALYASAPGQDQRIVDLGRSLLLRLGEIQPEDLVIFERLAVDPFGMVGESLLRLNDYAAAAKALEIGVQVYPLHTRENTVLLARAHIGLKQFDKAQAMLAQVLADSPANAQALYWLAASSESRGATDDAARQYQTLLRLAPDSPEARLASQRVRALAPSPAKP